MIKSFFNIFFITIMTTLDGIAQKPTLPTAIVPDGLGYNIHFTDAKEGELEMLAGSGATIVRMDFGWSSTERQKGVYNFAAFERLTDALEKHKIRPLYILDYSNRNYDEGLSPYSPEGRAAFARWATEAALHFKDRGIIWEMYNEPNIHFWKPEPNPDDYILLALEVGKAMRKAAPNELYIGPATSEIDFDFLEKCFKAGLLEYWDAVSVHPYRQKPPETVVEEYAKLRWLIDHYAPEDKHIPILSAEWGYSSAWGSYNDDIQGKMLARQWLINLACDIPISIWYDWHNDGTDPKEPEHHFGTVDFLYHNNREPVYDPKPAYIAAQTFNETFRGYQFIKSLYIESKYPENDNNPFVFLFKKGSDVQLAVWTTEKEPQTIVIPCSNGTFNAISYLGKELPELTSTNNELTLTVTDEPVYLIPKSTNSALSQVVLFKRRYDLAQFFPSRQCDDEKFFNRLSQRLVMDITYEIEGAKFKEKGVFYPAYPLKMSVPMIENNELIVHFDNTGGEAFSGKLLLEDVSGFQLRTNKPVDVHLKSGEFQGLFRIPIIPSTNGVYSFTRSITENNKDHFVRKVTQRFCLVDDFSKYDATTLLDNWDIMPEGDSTVASAQSIEPGKNGALKVTYQFDEGWKFLRLTPKNQTFAQMEDKPQMLALRIDADGSGNSIRIRFRDNQGQTFQVNGEKMNRKGMQYFTFDLTGKNSMCWGGPKDGVVHYPISFDSVIIDGTRKASDSSFQLEVFSPVLVYDM